MIRFNGHFDGKVIIPDEPVDLKPGEKLQITAQNIQPDQPSNTHWQDIAELIKDVESLSIDLPSDLAVQHDHYLYGSPKR